VSKPRSRASDWGPPGADGPSDLWDSWTAMRRTYSQAAPPVLEKV